MITDYKLENWEKCDGKGAVDIIDFLYFGIGGIDYTSTFLIFEFSCVFSL